MCCLLAEKSLSIARRYLPTLHNSSSRNCRVKLFIRLPGLLRDGLGFCFVPVCSKSFCGSFSHVWVCCLSSLSEHLVCLLFPSALLDFFLFHAPCSSSGVGGTHLPYALANDHPMTMRCTMRMLAQAYIRYVSDSQ